MKSIQFFLVALIGMMSFTSVASPIDNGEKSFITSVQCSKEYVIVDKINDELKVATTDYIPRITCNSKKSFSADDTTYIQTTCYQESNGTYTKIVSLIDSGGSPQTMQTTTGLSYCSCN